MRPAQREQADDRQEEYSRLTALHFEGTEEITRQEFKDDADIEKILSKFGINPMTRQPLYGAVVDDSLDLQQAIAAINLAKRADFKIPPELKGRYPDWQSLLNGVESGQYQLDLANLEAHKKRQEQAIEQGKKPDTPPAPPAPTDKPHPPIH